jgi:6-phosphogluconate dehydrogenase
MIGLGRMGGNMVRRLMRGGHSCVVFDQQPASVSALAGAGAIGAHSLGDFIDKLAPPRAVWLMLPAAVVDRAVDEISGLLQPDDIVIDGGNSYYADDVRRARALAARQLHYVDVGRRGSCITSTSA